MDTRKQSAALATSAFSAGLKPVALVDSSFANHILVQSPVAKAPVAKKARVTKAPVVQSATPVVQSATPVVHAPVVLQSAAPVVHAPVVLQSATPVVQAPVKQSPPPIVKHVLQTVAALDDDDTDIIEITEEELFLSLPKSHVPATAPAPAPVLSPRVAHLDALDSIATRLLQSAYEPPAVVLDSAMVRARLSTSFDPLNDMMILTEEEIEEFTAMYSHAKQQQQREEEEAAAAAAKKARKVRFAPDFEPSFWRWFRDSSGNKRCRYDDNGYGSDEWEEYFM